MPHFYVESIKSSRFVIVQDSGTMNSHTTIDVFIMLVIFLALITSLCILAWRYPTSHRAIPMHGAALPAPNIAPPVPSIATHRHSFAYVLHLLGMPFVIRWWARASPNRTHRIPSIMILHREDTVARALPASGAMRSHTRTLTLTSTIAPISSGGAGITNTLSSETIELHDLRDGTKCLSTSSLTEIDDAERGESVIHICVGSVSEAIEPSRSTVCPMLEVDIVDDDIVAIGDQSCK